MIVIVSKFTTKLKKNGQKEILIYPISISVEIKLFIMANNNLNNIRDYDIADPRFIKHVKVNNEAII